MILGVGFVSTAKPFQPHRAFGEEYENKLSVRLYQVHQDIESKGHYELTYEELVFGARTAWRNAPRCVNRIVWRQLEVLLVVL